MSNDTSRGTRSRTRVLAPLVAVAAAALVAGCGGGSSSTTTPSAGGAAAGSGNATAGRTVFTTNCASCHTLADAGSTGAVGPNLDRLRPNDALVTRQVTNGGNGMPAFGGQLSRTDIANVASYVSSVAGTTAKGGTSGGAGGAATP